MAPTTPKRKRGDKYSEPDALKRSPAREQNNAEDSPRTKVAARFEIMHLAPPSSPSPTPSKRTKMDDQKDMAALPVRSQPSQEVLSPQGRRYASPPPPTPITSPLADNERSHATARPISPLELTAALETTTEEDNGLGISESSLTWQDSEITGHEIDTCTGEDDGEGINGVGFRPTAAMAQARSERRRQQVSEWRAREAREARQKRLERRRADATVRVDDSGGGERRVVRFAM